MRQLVIEPEAEAELAEAYNWYQQQRAGLGVDFEMCIKTHPNRFQKVHGEVRRAVVKRFPYLVLFADRNLISIVIAIFNAKRDPTEWKKRL
jgi:hypothetical protein